jgi:hypothetical protein
MTQIHYRNHEPLPLFSHVNRHAPPRNHFPATAERHPVAGSTPEGASNHLRLSEADRGGVSRGSTLEYEGRKFANHGTNEPAKPQMRRDQSSDLGKPSPHADLHHRNL